MASIPWESPILGNAELRLHDAAEHIMGMPALGNRRWTAADVRELMDDARAWPRYELLDGELLVTNAPSVAHQVAVSELVARLRPFCQASQLGIALASPADLELRAETITQPDVFVVPRALVPEDEPLRWPAITSLLLAIEVLSPSTMRDDRVRKRDFYLSSGVDEYWIVDLDARVIERWTRSHDRPDIRRDTLEWHPRGAASAFVLDVRNFFAANQGLKRYP